MVERHYHRSYYRRYRSITNKRVCASIYRAIVTNTSSVRMSGKSIVGVFEEIYPAWSRGERKQKESAHASENDRGGLILNPGDWRVLDETRRILATPDGTDALSDVKLKHAALTRRFDDTPYNLASCPFPFALLAQPVSYLCLSRILPSPRPRQARDRDSGSHRQRLFRTIRRTYSFFETWPKAHFTRYW